MKKLMLLFLVIMLVGTISAFEFDNVKTYDKETKTIEIRNSVLGIPFLQLGKVAEIQLNTPLDYYVPIGYKKVAEVQVVPFDNYNDAFKELELYDKRNKNTKIIRSYDYKYKTIKQVPIYETLCNETLSKNETIEYSNCVQVDSGKTKTEVVWKDLGLSDFKDGEVKTIGIFTEVLKNDSIEWIPNFFGVRINEWAIWTASLNVDIVAYWRLNETSGTNAEDATGNGLNLTASSGILNGTGGIIGTSADFTGGVFHMKRVSGIGTTGDTWSVSMWLNGSSASNQIIIDNRGAGFGILIRFDSGNLQLIDDGNNVRTLDILGDVLNGTWNNIVITGSGTALKYYLNGVSTTNVTIIAGDWDSPDDFVVGGIRPNGGNAATDYEGLMDEFGLWNRTLILSEVEQLYNNGIGITFTDVFPILPNITLIAPANASIFTASNVTFNVTVTDDSGVQNVTLFIDGIANETNNSGVNGTYIFERNMSEDSHNWSIGAKDNENLTSNSSVRTFLINSVNPSVIINSPIGRQSNIKIGDNETVTWNITDVNLEACVLDYNGANTTLNCTANITSFLYVNGINTLNIFANDTAGNSNTTTTTWDYNITQVNQSFDSPVFTTSAQTFTINITINSAFTDTPTSPSIIYNGTTTTGGSVTSVGGDNYTLSQTIDIPDIVNGTSDWLFSFTLNSSLFNSSTLQQTTTRLDLINCNANSFINFTFKNETLAEEDVNATFDSNWNYFIGSGTVSRTLSFTNATENPFYGFCLNAVNDTLFTRVNVSYSNSESQQRQFRPTLLTLTNVTADQVLFLLPTVDGLFNTFRTEDTLGNTIIGARGTITRTLGGSPITVAIDVTDGSGLVIFFLDPDITYTATFSATGFADNVFTFVPTTDLRTVIMGSVAAVTGGSNISLGLSYTIIPTNATLNNGTSVTFQFNVSSFETITFMGFNISNGTTTLLLVNQTGNGSISGALNTGTNRSFIGVFTITTINETLIITRTWVIEQSFIGDYSIFRQFTLFNEYNFRDFIRLLIVLSTLAIIMIFMSREIGIDEEVKMAVGILIVWAFSIVGWLDTGIALTSSSSNINNLTQFSNQYGIAIVSTVAAAYFILRRVFRQI